MTSISTQHYLLDQARRKLTPTLSTIPGLGLVDERLQEWDWPEFEFSHPPAGSHLKPVMGNSGLPVLGLAGSAFFEEAGHLGLRTVAEAFADRAYRSDGKLLPRNESGAVLHDPELIAYRVLTMVESGTVTAVDGTVLKVEVESVCVHGDSPGAAAIAMAVRNQLLTSGVELAAFT